MNKKLFLGMFAAAGMLFATSCSNDELDVVQQSSDQAQVTFSLGLEGGIATRAISDGTKANKLVYAVYKLNAETGQPELQNFVGSTNGQKVKDDFKSGDNVELTLAKGQTYQVAFWAQDGDCKAYNTADLTSVKVSYKAENSTDNAANNDELRDAFFKTVQFEVKGDKNIDVVLQRPFAQINVGVEQTDWNAAVASGIKVQNSEVEINNVANEINLLTGAVKGDETITYALNTIPNETLYVETDNTKDGKESYVWLSMSYVLVNDGSDSQPSFDGAQKSTLNGLKYTFEPESGNIIEFNEGLAGAPVQRNWRTNILGKILTGEVLFNITIDPVYEGDYIYPDGTDEQELEFAATFGGTYTMSGKVDLNTRLDVNADFTLEGQGNTLDVKNAVNYGIRAFNGTATINNVNLTSDQGGVSVSNGAKVVFNSGSVTTGANTNPRYNFYVTGAGSTATINGGNFSFTNTLKRAYIYADAGTTVYVNGGNFGKASSRDGYTAGILGTGTVIITGGTFGFDPKTWVADDYKAVKSGDKWYVVKDDVTVVSTDTEFQSALSSGGNIVLVGDVSYNKIDLTTQTQDVYIDALGHKITTTDSYGVQVSAGKNITLKNAEVVITKEGNSQTYAAGFKVENGDYNGKTITLDNCTIKMANTDWAYAVNMPASVKNLNLVIDNCTLEGAIALQCWGDNNTITVTNSDLICNYTTNAMYTSYCVALQGDDTYKAENNKLNISGCTFSYSGVDNFNSEIGSVVDRSGENTNNTINVSDCTYNNVVKAY